MLKNESKRKGSCKALLGILALLALVVVLENLNLWLPGVPSLLLPTSQLFVVLKKAAVYSLVAVSMNLLNGFTGLFSLGQAGFMLLGAYTYAILTVPLSVKDQVYYLYGGSAVKFSLPDLFGSIFGTSGVGGAVSLVLAVLLALILAGLVAAGFAYLIGLPVLRLKSDYLAIATLGFAEILRAFFQWNALGPITNGSNLLKSYPGFENATSYILLAGSMIAIVVLLINSTYGRAFKAIRDDEVAAEAMGINLAKHKRMAFIISSFFAGIGGGMLAMYNGTIAAAPFKSALTYEILLIVVIGGIGSITGSILASFLYIFSSEWLLRGLDSGTFLGINAPGIFKNGFRMAVFSVIIMVIVLFFRKGIMGDKELPDLMVRKAKKRKKEAAGK